MIEATALRKGAVFELGSDLFKVLEYSHTKIARGGATVKVRVRNLRSGVIVEKTFSGNDRVQDVRLDHSEVEYLYQDGDLYYFMDTETFEQPALSRDTVADIIPYLAEGLTAKLYTYNDEPIDLEIPVSVELKVVEAEPGYAGDTAQGATKQVTVSTGLTVQTPLFIEVGDVIRIDTRSGQYLTRV
ncbi:MAG: elongation factor P [Anaerolineae bacterium]